MKNRIRWAGIVIGILSVSQVSWSKKPPELRLAIDNPFFSPNRDGSRDILPIPVIAEGFKKIENWEVRIEDANGGAKRSSSGQKKVPPQLLWDGLDDFGAVVPEGNYQISFALWDTKLGIVSAPTMTVSVDFTPPTVSISQNKKPSAEDPSVGFLMSAVDLSGIESWKFEAQEVSGKSIYVQSSSGSLPSSLSWKPDAGALALGKGVGMLTVFDRAGNHNTSAPIEIYFGKAVPVPVKAPVRAQENLAKKYLQMTTIISVADLFGQNADRTSVLKPQASSFLNPLAQTLSGTPGARAVILGHVDAQAAPAEAKALSSHFAWQIFSSLVNQKGIDKNSLTVKGLGNDVPVGRDKSAMTRARNRRIEIQIFLPDTSAQ